MSRSRTLAALVGAALPLLAIADSGAPVPATVVSEAPQPLFTPRSLHFTPDDATLCAVDYGQARLVDLATGAWKPDTRDLIQVVRHPPSSLSRVAGMEQAPVSGTPTAVAYEAEGGGFVGLETGEVLVSWSQHEPPRGSGEPVTALAYDGSRDRVAAARGETITIYQVAHSVFGGRSLGEIGTLPAPGGTRALAFSRDGSRLARTEGDQGVAILDVAGGEVVHRVTWSRGGWF